MELSAFYFPHDIGASHDPKLLDLRMTFGWKSIGMYWAIIEALHKEPNGSLPATMITSMINGFYDQETDEKMVENERKMFEERLYANALLLHKGKSTTSKRVMMNLEKRQMKSFKSRTAAEVRWHKGVHKPLEYKKVLKCEGNATENANAMRTLCERNAIKGKERKEYIYIVHFESLWEKYPNKVGRIQAERHFINSVLNDQDVADINTALNNYLASKRVANGYVFNGSTWFHNWRDWITYKEPEVTPTAGGAWDR